MMDAVLETYCSLRSQAKKALEADSTLAIIAGNHRGYWRELHLCLSPDFWEITGFGARTGRKLAVPLPHAEDPQPMRALAQMVDRALMDWLWEIAGKLEGEEALVLRSFAKRTQRLDREMFGSPWKAAS